MSQVEVLLEAARFRVLRHTERLADGRGHTRDTIDHPGAVAILPLLDDGRICLIRNFRIAVGESLIEIPAGTLEPGEDPRKTAERELAEETGYTAQRFELLAKLWMSPGILRERNYLFVATGLTPGAARPELGERIEPFLVSWEEALALIVSGQIVDAKTVAGLLLYDRLRPQAKSDALA